MKDAVRRLRNRVKITFNNSKFEEEIKNLRELNDDLRRLREQEMEIKDPKTHANVALPQRPMHLDSEFGSIGKIRRASKSLHQALAAAWLESIDSTLPGSIRHNVKLSVDTNIAGEGRMEIVISCYGHDQTHLCVIMEIAYELIRLHAKI